MVLKLLQLILIPIFAIVLSACPNKPASSKSGASIHTVKGDPGVFVKGTAANGLRALPWAIAEQKIWDFDVSGFKEEAAETNFKKAVQEQAQEAQQAVMTTARLRTQNHQDQLVIEGIWKNRDARFVFKRSTNGWVPEAFSFNGLKGSFNQGSVQLIHTSVAADGSAFSLLLQSQAMGQRFVFELLFIKSMPDVSRLGNQLYEYMFGRGIKVAWSKQSARTLLICGTLPDPLPRLVQEEASRWAQALGNRLKFVTATRATCPPFSDLNTQTFQFISDWIEIQGEAATAAQAIPIAGAGRKELLDGDILFLLGEFEEAFHLKGYSGPLITPENLRRPQFQDTIRQVSLHEIGHLLGLHHQFDPSIQSIMSYNENLKTQLYDYDVKAIQHLYED